jgi:N-acetylated-alpha-linked acidic dipeptidase
MYPGDPTTPGYPSYENSTRTNASSLPSIPSLPISWANAKVLLEGIEGKNRTVRLINHGTFIFIATVFILTRHPHSG